MHQFRKFAAHMFHSQTCNGDIQGTCHFKPKVLLIADQDDDTAKNRTQLLFHVAIHRNYVGNRESKKSGILVHRWIDFWFKGKSKYSKPKPRIIKKASRYKATQNPNKEIEQPYKFSSKEESAFNTIGVKSHLREETYLAAFISCWLCVFALPNKDFHAVRPSTFKATSLMTSGLRTCLAMLVLLSIYRDFNKMAQAPIPGQSHLSFPMQYVYAWLAHYFHTHYITPSALPAPMMTNYSGEGGANILMTIRLVISSIRVISEGNFFVELYRSYKFAQQFRFYQDIPKELGVDGSSTNYDLCRIL
ncbi:hypothetical protein ACH5RR_025780 [Cinchona calisaya]|uniref:Aminotransferase-like plant mobile domain-containing protein n=1 Tax=Cinchona calisaya TaxID=153742 RepID=A0ABD2Z5N3_9GENT